MHVKKLALTIVVVLLMAFGTSSAYAATLSYTTGLDVWLDAQDINGNGDDNLGIGDGATVTTWVNKGVNSIGDATASFSSTPTYEAGDGPLAWQDAIYFSSTTDLDSFQLPEFMDSDTFSIFAVAKTTGGSGPRPIFWDYGTVGGEMIYFGARGDSRVRDDPPVQNVLSVASGSDWFNDWDRGMMILSSDEGTPEAFSLKVGPVGSTATATNAAYGSTTWEGIHASPTIGQYPVGGSTDNAFVGYMAEILIYDHAVTGTDRTAVLNYLETKYVPEPSTWAMLAMGAFGLLIAAWRRRK